MHFAAILRLSTRLSTTIALSLVSFAKSRGDMTGLCIASLRNLCSFAAAAAFVLDVDNLVCKTVREAKLANLSTFLICGEFEVEFEFEELIRFF